MCSYLKQQLNVDSPQLQDFESKVQQNFKKPDSYSNYVLLSLVPIPMLSITFYTTPLSHLSSFVSDCSFLISFSKSAMPNPSPTALLHLKISHNYLILISSDIPNTSKSCQSTLISPTSFTSLFIPPGYEDLSTRIIDAEGSLLMFLESLIAQPTLVSQKMAPYLTHTLSHHYHHYQDALKKRRVKMLSLQPFPASSRLAALRIFQFFLFFSCFISCFSTMVIF